MRFYLRPIKSVRLVAATGILAAAGSVASGQQLTPPKVDGEVVDGEVEVQVEATVEADDNSPWIGVAGVDLPPALAAQLKLDAGVLVEDVVPDSPAAKAGVQKHDVLVSLGEKAVTSRDELVAAVKATGEAEAELSLLRAGEKQSVKITPSTAPRPTAPEAEAGLEIELQPFIKELGKLRGEHPRRMLLLGPGVMPPGLKLDSGEFPGNLTVEIKKEGDQPAKITVKRGDDSWEITSEELAKLPEELRPHVEKFLGGGVLGGGVLGGQAPMMLRQRIVRGFGAGEGQVEGGEEERIVEEGAPGEVRERRIRRIAPPGVAPEAMRKHLEEMRRHLDAMRGEFAQPEGGLNELREEVERLRKEVEELREQKQNADDGAAETGSPT